MNKLYAYQKLNLFFLRLSEYIIISGLLNLLFAAVYKTTDYLYASWLFLIPFTVFFLLKELVDIKNLALSFQITAALIFAIFIHFSLKGAAFIYFLYAAIFVLMIHSFLSRTFDYKQSALNICIFFYTLVLIYLYMMDIQEMLIPFLINLLLAIICRYICMHFYNMDLYINSYECRRHTQSQITILCMHNGKLLLIYISLLTIICAPVLAFGRTFGIELSPIKRREIIDSLPKWTEFQLELERDINIEALPEEGVYDQLLGYNDKNKALTIDAVKKLLVILFVAVMIIGVVFYRMSRQSKLPLNSGDEVYDSEDFVGEKRKRKRRLHVPSANQQVRRMFVKKVREHMKSGLVVRTSSTAEKISDKINETEDVTLLNEVYHRARYSGEVIEKSEINALNNKKRQR